MGSTDRSSAQKNYCLPTLVIVSFLLSCHFAARLIFLLQNSKALSNLSLTDNPGSTNKLFTRQRPWAPNSWGNYRRDRNVLILKTEKFLERLRAIGQLWVERHAETEQQVKRAPLDWSASLSDFLWIPACLRSTMSPKQQPREGGG